MTKKQVFMRIFQAKNSPKCGHLYYITAILKCRTYRLQKRVRLYAWVAHHNNLIRTFHLSATGSDFCLCWITYKSKPSVSLTMPTVLPYFKFISFLVSFSIPQTLSCLPRSQRTFVSAEGEISPEILSLIARCQIFRRRAASYFSLLSV